MAFNPFQKFRKHQKVLMAISVMLAMVTFVLCSGAAGGFDSWFKGVLTRQTQQEEVATLYGRKVGKQELYELQRQRLAANTFMSIATKQIMDERREELKKLSAKSADSRGKLEEMSKEISLLEGRLVATQQFGMPYFYSGIEPDGKPIGRLDAEGLIDFLIWKHEADRLGITISDEGLLEIMGQLTYGGLLDRQRRRSVFQTLRRNQFAGLTDESLTAALKDEIRVNMARASLTGFDPLGITTEAASFTPHDFYDYFREKRTLYGAFVIPVKVEDFVSQVKAPSEKELVDLYEKYKNQEYDPARPDPGFKQPRRVQVEWIGSGTDTPALLQASEVAYYLAPPLTHEVQLQESLDQNWRKFRAASWTRDWNMLDASTLHDENLNQRSDVAAAIGQLTGSVGTRAPLVSAVAAYEGPALSREVKGRMKRGVTQILTAANPSPLPSGALAWQITSPHRTLPLETVEPFLSAEIKRELAEKQRDYMLDLLRKEVETRGKKRDIKGLQAYLADAVKKNQFTTGKTTELRDRYRNKLESDPGLKELMDAYQAPPSRDPTGKNFAEMFFIDLQASQIQQSMQDLRPFHTQEFPFQFQFPGMSQKRFGLPPNNKVYMFWQSENQSPQVVSLSNPQVRKEVEEAWKLIKARALARKKAEELAQQAMVCKGDAKELRDWTEKQKLKAHDLPPIAPLMYRRSVKGTSTGYSPPTVATQANVPDIPDSMVPYATESFCDSIMKLKKVGESTVLPDFPERTYYVTILSYRDEPSEAQFFALYRDSAPGIPHRDPMIMYFERDLRGKYLRSVIDRLRADAKLTFEVKAKQEFDSHGGGPGGSDD